MLIPHRRRPAALVRALLALAALSSSPSVIGHVPTAHGYCPQSPGFGRPNARVATLLRSSSSPGGASVARSSSPGATTPAAVVPPSARSPRDETPASTEGRRRSNDSDDVVPAMTAAKWHKHRRRRMLQKYGDEIGPLERESDSQTLGLSLLLLSNASLFGLSLLSGRLSPLQVALLALFPGSMFSLWTLQILHDLLHGSLLSKRRKEFLGMKRSNLQDFLLFWGSMPSAFGYYLYLKYGHLTHHRSLGDERSASLKQLFESDQKDFEDGDVLFVAHRMKLKGEVGPTFTIGGRDVTMSISKTGFDAWKDGRPIRNALAFAASFMYERFMLTINDVVVAVTGRNYFFPNKPRQFHAECARYCRCAVAVRGTLCALAGWKSLLFLYLSETLWSIPPHPACAMFVTNHGSNADPESGGCVPSSSTYAGRWYSTFTLGTNYHCEHHDFPTIPLHRLGELRRIAPEFYREGSGDDVFSIMRGAFSRPQFYACMDANIL